jgi:SPP1 family phage portal protein
LINSEFYIDIYSAKEVQNYKSDSSFTSFQLLDMIPNYYQQVPVIVFPLNEEWESIFDKIMSLQDAYNTLLSSEVDDFQAFVMAYLVLQGIDDVDPEALHLMRTNRVLQLPQGGSAEFLTKNISDTQISNMLDSIRDSIREISACPDFNDNAFGTSSGVAIKYKLLNFENRAGSIEKQMTMALQRRIELICAITSLIKGEDVWRDIQIIFTRNLPIDYADITSMINNLRGLVSNKTLIAQLPFVTDVDAELEAVEEQNAANASLYNFSSSGNEVEDDELLEG